MCGEKTHYKRKAVEWRLFKGTGVVLAGIECSPKIFDFRANGITDQKSVEFSTLAAATIG